jgi:hypothetical protein
MKVFQNQADKQLVQTIVQLQKDQCLAAAYQGVGFEVKRRKIQMKDFFPMTIFYKNGLAICKDKIRGL